MKKKLILILSVMTAALMLTACTALKKEGESGVISGADHVEEQKQETPPQAGTTQNVPVQTESVQEDFIQEAADNWTGAYAGDDETVSIALIDEATISFAFAQSGISGTAKVNGLQAVYNGDDHYVVVFNLNGSILDVSVSNEEDYDASDSPLNGTYVKE